MCLTNAFIMHKHICLKHNVKPVEHIDFQVFVVHLLMDTHVPLNSNPLPTTPSQDSSRNACRLASIDTVQMNTSGLESESCIVGQRAPLLPIHEELSGQSDIRDVSYFCPRSPLICNTTDNKKTFIQWRVLCVPYLG